MAELTVGDVAGIIALGIFVGESVKLSHGSASLLQAASLIAK